MKEVSPAPLSRTFKKGYLLYNLVSVLATTRANRLRAVGALLVFSWGNFLKKSFPHTPSKTFKKGYLLYNLVSVLATTRANRLRAVGALFDNYLPAQSHRGIKKQILLSKGDNWERALPAAVEGAQPSSPVATGEISHGVFFCELFFCAYGVKRKVANKFAQIKRREKGPARTPVPTSLCEQSVSPNATFGV